MSKWSPENLVPNIPMSDINDQADITQATSPTPNEQAGGANRKSPAAEANRFPPHQGAPAVDQVVPNTASEHNPTAYITPSHDVQTASHFGDLISSQDSTPKRISFDGPYQIPSSLSMEKQSHS